MPISQDRVVALITAVNDINRAYETLADALRSALDSPNEDTAALLRDHLRNKGPSSASIRVVAHEQARFTPARIRANAANAARLRTQRLAGTVNSDGTFGALRTPNPIGTKTKAARTRGDYELIAIDGADDNDDTFAETLRTQALPDDEPLISPAIRALIEKDVDEALRMRNHIPSPPVPPELLATAPFTPNIVEHIDVPPPDAKPSK